MRSASCGPPSDRTWLYSPSGTKYVYDDDDDDDDDDEGDDDIL